MQKDKLIDEFNSYRNFEDDWDDEGASKPKTSSINTAILFVELIETNIDLETLIHATGNTGLFYNELELYVDIEFISDKVLWYIRKIIDNQQKWFRGDFSIKGENPEIPKQLIDLLQ